MVSLLNSFGTSFITFKFRKYQIERPIPIEPKIIVEIIVIIILLLLNFKLNIKFSINSITTIPNITTLNTNKIGPVKNNPLNINAINKTSMTAVKIVPITIGIKNNRNIPFKQIVIAFDNRSSKLKSLDFTLTTFTFCFSSGCFPVAISSFTGTSSSSIISTTSSPSRNFTLKI